MQPDPSVKKVLIYRLGSLGDTTVALPCFHLIERSFPNSERILLTNFPVHAKAPASAAVLGESGPGKPNFVHGYMRYAVGTRSPRELLRLAKEIRRFKPDVLVYLMPIRPLKMVTRDKWFFRFAAGVERIIGLPGPAELVCRQDSITGIYESEASRLARTITILGDASTEDLINWDPRLTAGERAVAVTALEGLNGRPFLVCSPGCKMQANDWEQENWRALLGRLVKHYPGHGLVLTGAKEDHAACEFASQDWTGPRLNLAGTLTPRESAAIFAQAALFLGPDSGPKSIAASVGAPCVCVFSARGRAGQWFPPGHRSIVLYHEPECHGCRLETCIVEKKKCILSVTVAEVEAATLKLLPPTA